MKFNFKKISKKGIAFGISAGVALGLTGAAFAYWTSTGAGTGTGTTGSAGSTLTIAQTTTISGLAPGVAAEAVSGTITNGSAQSQYVTSVTASIASVSGGTAGTYTCSAADYTLANPTVTINTDLTPSPTAGDTTTFTGPTIAFKDLPTVNQDDCQGATVHLSYSSN